MKILFILPDIPESDSSIGGIGVQTENIVKALAPIAEICVVYMGTNQPKYPIQGVKYFPINVLTMRSDSLLLFQMGLLYRAMCLDFIPDIIAYADVYCHPVAKFMKDRYRQAKVVCIFTLSNFFTEESVRNLYGKSDVNSENYYYPQEIDACTSSDLVIVNAPWISHYYPMARNISIIPNAIDFDAIVKVPKAAVVGKKPIRIGVMQRLSENKGLLFLQNLTLPSNTELIIMGKGFDQNRTDMEAKKLTAKGYTFLGHITGNERFAVAKTFDFMLFPNTFEPFCISILESMACGVIPIYTQIPGMGDIARPCGIPIPYIPYSFDKTLAEINKCLSVAVNLSETDKAIMRQKGLEHVKNFYGSWEKCRNMYVDVFKQLV